MNYYSIFFIIILLSNKGNKMKGLQNNQEQREYEMLMLEWELSPDNPENYPLNEKIEYYEEELRQIEDELHCGCYEDRESGLNDIERYEKKLRELYKVRRK